MNDIIRLLNDDRLSKILLDALPCGLMLINKQGNVLAVNNVFEHAFGVRNIDVVRKALGGALGCLQTCSSLKACGRSPHCTQCEIRKLANTALLKNSVQRARIYIQLIFDKQVRDTNLMLCAAPFVFDQMPLCLLMIENLSTVGFLSRSEKKNDNWGIVGRSEKMLELFSEIRDVAQTDAPVLIRGESGTGKELVAHAIHKESMRAYKLFVPVNCGALPVGLLESELFGHKKGAFTGATHDKKGRFGIADGGTLFLDEVSELDLSLQVKFLRVLENGCFEPLGSDQTTRVDVRVISATNKDLLKLLKNGRFREDLFYRICVMPINLAPLRERKEDIPILSEHFLAQFSRSNWRAKPSVSREVRAILMNHNWPGNVRELKNVLQYAMVKCKGETIEPMHIPDFLSQSKPLRSRKRHREPKIYVSDVDKALKQTKGNRSRAARILGVSRSTLYRTIQRDE
jgi:transcriptional regulator with PAS, ATPase and Fis domain